MRSSLKKNICKAIKDQGGDYFFVVKDNQKSRRKDIEHYFNETPTTPIENTTLGHGRVETRRLWVQRTPWNLYHWHKCKHLCKIERIRYNKSTGKESTEIAYAITSLEDHEASPEKLLQLWQDHWKIENQLHWTKDVEFQEDRSIVRKGNSPRFFSCIRNKSIEILANRKNRLKYERETLARFPGRSIKVLNEN